MGMTLLSVFGRKDAGATPPSLPSRTRRGNAVPGAPRLKSYHGVVGAAESGLLWSQMIDGTVAPVMPLPSRRNWSFLLVDCYHLACVSYSTPHFWTSCKR